MNDYTKGPWTTRDNGIYGADGYGIAYPIGQAITKLGSDEYSHQWITRNQEANAHLIAAAPELMEALDNLLRYAAMRSDWLANGFDEPADHPISIARAAIAKAKGETK